MIKLFLSGSHTLLAPATLHTECGQHFSARERGKSMLPNGRTPQHDSLPRWRFRQCLDGVSSDFAGNGSSRWWRRHNREYRREWSGRPDLNWGPLGPEPSALPGYATPRQEGFRLQSTGYRKTWTDGIHPHLSPVTSIWSGRADLNCRPLAPQASALPGCATSRPHIIVPAQRGSTSRAQSSTLTLP